MSARSLEQWLHYLEHRDSVAIRPRITEVKKIAGQLELDCPSCPVITVTGTNGKGSTVSALESIYATAGYKVGAYTSPHLLYFNERIRVNLKPISDEALCSAFAFIDNAEKKLTYFEITTLAALWYFKQSQLDVIILEVGLGGRWDATNIIDPALAIITTVNYDHQAILGDTLEQIGYEKAGILRSGKPFIYADLHPPTTVQTAAKELPVSSAYYYNIDYSYKEEDQHWTLHYLGRSINLPIPKIGLKSAAAAVLATSILRHDLPVALEHIQQALTTLFIPGRLQLEQKNDLTILYDVSHNPQAAALLAQQIRKIATKQRVHAVFAALRDKDILGIISLLKDCIDRWYPAQLTGKRAASADLMLSLFREAEIIMDICYNSPLIAFNEAVAQAEPGDLIVVFGSFLTVGQIMTDQHRLLE